MGKQSISNGGFTVDFLAGDRAVVSQGDHEILVDTTQFFGLKQRDEFAAATAEYDAAVKAFHAPMTEAADKLAAAKLEPADDTFIIVLKPAVEGVLSAPAEIAYLEKDTVILRFIEADTTDRLIWVAGDLEVRAN